MALFKSVNPSKTAPERGQFTSKKKENNIPLLILLMIVLFG